jgi:hypothetical protein
MDAPVKRTFHYRILRNRKQHRRTKSFGVCSIRNAGWNNGNISITSTQEAAEAGNPAATGDEPSTRASPHRQIGNFAGRPPG